MTEPMSKRVPQLLVALVALFGIVAISVALIGGGGDDSGSAPSSPIEIGEQLSPADEAVRSAERFLDTYVEDTGRVVRIGDDDTVSEGQAYAMLISVAIDDRDTFASVWNWTRDNLRGESGTLAWRWKDGAVLDPNAATDADLDAARALVMAADRFDEPEYRADGIALADALYRENVVVAGGNSMMVAGPWTNEAPYFWNPSYLAPASFDVLASATGNSAWTDLREDGTDLIYEITDDGGRLPPDWASLEQSGAAEVTPPPGGGEVTFGYDAFRTLQRMSEACDTRSRELASAMLPDIEQAIAASTDTTDLDGNPRSGGANPLFLLSAAAAVDVGGDDERANSLADEAERVDAGAPSYYLGAWVALTRLMIDTDRLDVCSTTAGDGSA